VNPNSKIPAIVDAKGPNGQPITIFESGAVLIYLAEKYGKFLPKDATKRYHTIQWLMWQMGGVGPMFGQFGHFTKYAKEDVPYAKKRYTDEVKRLHGVLDKQLATNEFIAGDEYTIADMAVFPWVRGIDVFYNGREVIGHYPNIDRWFKQINERPAVQRGLLVAPFTA